MRFCFLVAALSAFGCYSPTPAEGLPCSPSGRCPEGQQCGADNVCRSMPLPPRDAGADASTDAGVDPLIDPAVRVSETEGRSDEPSLAWTGSEYGVAWVDDRGGNEEIFFTRVSASGELRGPPVRVTDAAGEARSPSLCWTGAEYGLAWADEEDGDFEIYFIRISADGAPIGPASQVTDAAEYSLEPSMVWTGSEFGVAWHDSRGGNFEIYFNRLALDGTKLGDDLPVTAAGSVSTSPSLVWTGTGFGIAWDDFRNASNNEIYFAKVTAAGAKSGGDIRVTDAGGYSSGPALAWTGIDFGVAWGDARGEDPREIYFARLAATGNNASGDLRVSETPGRATGASALYTGEEFAVAYRDNPGGESNDVLLARLDGDGAPLGAPVPVAEGPAKSIMPDLVWTGSVFAIAWVDDRDGNDEIYLVEVP